MLSTLVQRQKIWTMPLLLSLAFSWCLMLCQNLAQATTVLPTDVTYVAPVTATPPCHSQVASTEIEQTTTLLTQHCSGCDNQAAAAEPLSLAFAAVLISWQGMAQLTLPVSAIPAIALHTPPPRPRVPLYLAKNLLLI